MLPQITLTFLLALALIEAVPPSIHKKKTDELDEDPPKYEYEYKIQHDKEAKQGKVESRDGELSSGRYYVQGKDSSQKVEYVADDLGYHPYVEYTNINPHGQTVAQIALDTESLKTMKAKNSKLPELQNIVELSRNKQQNNIYKSTDISKTNVQHQNVVYLQNSGELEKALITNQKSVRGPSQQNVIYFQHTHPHEDTAQQIQENNHANYQQQQQQNQLLEQQQQKLQWQQQRQQRQQQQQQQQHHQRKQQQQRQQQQQQPQQQQQKLFVEDQEQQQNDIQHSQSQHQTVTSLGQSVNVNPTVLVPVQQFSTLAPYTQNSNKEGFIVLQQQNPVYSVSQQNHQPQLVSVVQAQGQNSEQQGSLSLQSSYSSLEDQASILAQGGAVPLNFFNNQLKIDPQQSSVVLQNLQNAINQLGGNIVLQQLNYGPSTTDYQSNQQQSPSLTFFRQDANYPQQVQQHIQTQTTKPETQIQFETAALYENPGSKLITEQNSVGNAKNNRAPEDLSSLSNRQGKYGSKLNVEVISNSRQPFKFLRNLRKLVTGQDVLNINQVVGQNLDAKAESTTAATAIVSEYGPSESSRAVTLRSEVVMSPSSKLPNVASAMENIIGQGHRSKLNHDIEDDKISLSKQPIIVSDVENYSENNLETSTRSYSNNKELNNVVSFQGQDATESTIVVTPRPINSQFLAPITAGIQLNTDVSQDENFKHNQQNIVVDIQKSIPYYLGKIEYYDQANGFNNKNINTTASATQNILLGGFLQNPIEQSPKAESLIQEPKQLESGDNLFSQTLHIHQKETNGESQEIKQIQEQVQTQQESVIPNPQFVQAVAYPIQITKVVEKPVHVTKYVDKPFPVHVPIHVPVQVPVTVEKRVPVPVKVEVEKIVEKPITITKVIEKQVPVPQLVEKRVEVPVHITKYIDRPYPVHVAVPKPVPYPVEVEKVVEKIVQRAYPVEVRVPVQVPVHVPVPQPVQVTVEKKVPVLQYIEKPVPVEKIIEKPVPQYVPKPYPVAIKVPIPYTQAIYVPVAIPKPYPVEVTKYINKPYVVPKPYPVQLTQTIEVPVTQPVPVEVRIPHPVPVEVPKIINKVVDRHVPILFKNEYNLKPPKPPANLKQLTYAASYQSSVATPCVDLRVLGIKNPYCPTINNNNYIGMVPPKISVNSQYLNSTLPNVRKQRTAKQFDDSNVRLEYGFMPPLIPSLAVDEEGNPVEKHTK